MMSDCGRRPAAHIARDGPERRATARRDPSRLLGQASRCASRGRLVGTASSVAARRVVGRVRRLRGPVSKARGGQSDRPGQLYNARGATSITISSRRSVRTIGVASLSCAPRVWRTGLGALKAANKAGTNARRRAFPYVGPDRHGTAQRQRKLLIERTRAACHCGRRRAPSTAGRCLARGVSACWLSEPPAAHPASDPRARVNLRLAPSIAAPPARVQQRDGPLLRCAPAGPAAGRVRCASGWSSGCQFVVRDECDIVQQLVLRAVPGVRLILPREQLCLERSGHSSGSGDSLPVSGLT